jgi:hypothetical protein
MTVAILSSFLPNNGSVKRNRPVNTLDSGVNYKAKNKQSLHYSQAIPKVQKSRGLFALELKMLSAKKLLSQVLIIVEFP